MVSLTPARGRWPSISGRIKGHAEALTDHPGHEGARNDLLNERVAAQHRLDLAQLDPEAPDLDLAVLALQ